jgi:transcriptional regulator with XRE-family HTH domain
MTTDDIHSLGEYLRHWRLKKGLPLEVIALRTRIPLRYLRALEATDFSTLPPLQTLPHTLGESLRECRQQQGLTLERIAEQTRIPLSYLLALEENDALHLPGALVITRAYINAYLDCLSLPEEQKQDVLLQFARLAETVYVQSARDSSEHPGQKTWFGQQWTARPLRTARAFRNTCHEHALAAYLQLVQWRVTFCRRIASATRAVVACIRQGFNQVAALSASATRTTIDTVVAYSAHLLQNGGIGQLRQSVWPHALTAGPWQIRHSFILLHRDTGSFSDRHAAGDQTAHHGGLGPAEASSGTNSFVQRLGAKMWVWVVQYGITILLLLLLGSVAANIPLFKETVLPETKLDASHLVEFLGYSGALVMVWLMGRRAAAQLDRDHGGFSFLRPLVTPLTALLIASASYKVLLVLLAPFLDKSDRLTYNWVFVALIVASTLWLILAWFLKSAPMLESLETAGRGKQPIRGATSIACSRCGTSVPAGMKFCGQCGAALAAPQD